MMTKTEIKRSIIKRLVGKTQRELAEDIGISQSAMTQLLSGYIPKWGDVRSKVENFLTRKPNGESK